MHAQRVAESSGAMKENYMTTDINTRLGAQGNDPAYRI